MDAERLKTIVLEKRKGLVAASHENDVEINNIMALGDIDQLKTALKKRAKINRRLEVINEILLEAE